MRVRFRPSPFRIRQAAKQLCRFVLGTIFGTPDATIFAPGEKEASTGFAVIGAAGTGKSRLLQQLYRELFLQGQGFTFIDPNNDTAEDLFAWLTYHHKEFGLRKEEIYFLKPDEAPIAFDIFEYSPDPDDPHANSEHKYRAWLHGRIKDLVLIIMRKQGETEDDAQKMVRLKRWLFNALYAVGVRQADGSHLSLNDAIALLTPKHQDHERLYAQVEPYLDPHVRADFEKLRKTGDPRKQEEWVESSLNRLREIDSPTMRLVFGRHGKPFDFKRLILNRGALIAAVGRTDYFHQDEAQVYAALLIRKINDVVRTIPREQRTRHWLGIDEAHHFVGEDMISMFKEGRKFLLSLGIGFQQVDNLQKGEVDLVPTVLGICSMRITFRQKFHEHAEILAHSLCFPLLKFKELIHVVERHGGYEWVTVVSQSFSRNTSGSVSRSVGKSRSVSQGITRGESEGETYSLSDGTSYSDSETVSRGRSLMKGRSVSFSESDTASRSTSDGKNEGVNETTQTSEGTGQNAIHSTGTSLTSPPDASEDTRGKNDGRSTGNSTSVTTSNGRSHSSSTSHSITTGVSRERSRGQQLSTQQGENEGTALGRNKGKSRSQSRGRSVSRSESNTFSESHGSMNSLTVGVTEGETEGFTITPTSQAIVEQHDQHTGRYEKAVSDQLAEHTHTIMTLPHQHCLVALDTDQAAFVMRVANVLDPFEERGYSPGYREAVTDAFKKWIYARHDCYVIPNHNPPVAPGNSSKGPGLT